MSNRRVASRSRFVARGSGCSRGSRTAAGNVSAGWGAQLLSLSGAVAPFAGQVVQGPAASAGSDSGHDADRAAIEKLKQQDVTATVARDAVAMANLWTDDAVRFGPDTPADVGKQAIRETNERSTARPIKVLTFVPETKDLTIWDGGAVEWRYFTASIVASPGGEPEDSFAVRRSRLANYPDGSWKCFPRDGDHRMSCNTGGADWHAAGYPVGIGAGDDARHSAGGSRAGRAHLDRQRRRSTALGPFVQSFGALAVLAFIVLALGRKL